MKDYLNVFHAIVSEIHFWNDLNELDKKKKISVFLENYEQIDHLIDYFEIFDKDLSKKTLNFYLKSVNKH